MARLCHPSGTPLP